MLALAHRVRGAVCLRAAVPASAVVCPASGATISPRLTLRAVVAHAAHLFMMLAAAGATVALAAAAAIPLLRRRRSIQVSPVRASSGPPGGTGTVTTVEAAAASRAPRPGVLAWPAVVLDRIDAWFERPRVAHVVRLAERIGHLAIIVTAGKYLSECPARKKEAHNAAWQVINTAQDKGGSGGRIEALQDLAADGVALDGVVLTNAYLVGIKLPPHVSLRRAHLGGADASGAWLDSANLSGATLTGAVLQHASLSGANLVGARLDGANLTGATLIGAYLDSATLIHAGLEGARLDHAHLVQAHLDCADLTGAWLTGADMTRTTLIGAGLKTATLTSASLWGARLDSANLWGARLTGIRDWHQIENIQGANVLTVLDAPPGFWAWALDTMRAAEHQYLAGEPPPARSYCHRK